MSVDHSRRIRKGQKGKVRVKTPQIAAILDSEKSLHKLKITSLWGSLSSQRTLKAFYLCWALRHILAVACISSFLLLLLLPCSIPLYRYTLLLFFHLYTSYGIVGLFLPVATRNTCVEYLSTGHCVSTFSFLLGRIV